MAHNRPIETLVQAALDELKPTVRILRTVGWDAKLELKEIDGEVSISAVIYLPKFPIPVEHDSAT